MNNKLKKETAAAAVILLCAMLAGCGCGKKETDPASQQVLEISITPEPTPTEAPEETDPSAVVSEGNITMVNSYLVENGAEDSDGQDTAEDGNGAEATGVPEDESDTEDSGEE